MRQLHAEVIGGGIGGLTVATALARHGWTVRLHERQPEIRAVGAGIYMWDNGLHALESIGAFESATRGAHLGPAVEAHGHDGRVLYRIEINTPGRPRCYTLLRDRLIGALVDAAGRAGVELVTDSAAVAVGADGSVEFEDGASAAADLVVAADGVHSRLRDHLGQPGHRIRMTQGAARMMVPMSSEYFPAAAAVEHHEFFHRNRRLLYTPCTADQVYLAFVSDVDDSATRGSHIDVTSWQRSFPTLGPLLEAARGVPFLRWDTFEYIRLNSWSQGRVAFLGDAAHAQPPYLGQGGGTAMTNAVALAAAVSRPGRALPDALVAWERGQRPDVERTQRTSYRMRLLNSVPDAVRDPLLSLVGRTSTFANSQLAATRIRPVTSAGATV